MMYKLNFGFKIKKLRESHNISQELLAQALEISQSKLSKIENGRIKKIDFVFVQKICDKFSITTDELVDNAIKK
ncbi:helix-turn-helix transcriptional regulator [Chryseobacterium sp. RG1]|uniref:Helix-turn-helix transcriptional regulator n=1 Tax=Chryseobacterium tagetis TaxID=2801334 RepID=A0ABS8A6J2_9FLAO|nr:helix-turn-helix transcriptional regulator [Chryseobacterium tagetis]MCA6068240.1 helix-turn-helix transcriptional regulator [Chryseobacterium tagetis]